MTDDEEENIDNSREYEKPHFQCIERTWLRNPLAERIPNLACNDLVSTRRMADEVARFLATDFFEMCGGK